MKRQAAMLTFVRRFNSLPPSFHARRSGDQKPKSCEKGSSQSLARSGPRNPRDDRDLLANVTQPSANNSCTEPALAVVQLIRCEKGGQGGDQAREDGHGSRRSVGPPCGPLINCGGNDGRDMDQRMRPESKKFSLLVVSPFRNAASGPVLDVQARQ